MSLNILLACFMFLNSLVALAAEDLKIPIFLSGVRDDKANRVGQYYSYRVNGQFTPKEVSRVWSEKNKTIESLVGSLLFCYQQNDKKQFKKLFTPAVLKIMDAMPDEVFNKTWDVYAKRKNTKLDFYYNFRKGVLLGLKSESNKDHNIQYAVQKDGVWVFDALETDDSDLMYHNVGLWLSFRPFKFAVASMISKFTKSDAKKIAMIQVQSPYVGVFKREQNVWYMMGLSIDNGGDKANFIDNDPAPGIVKLDLSDSLFPDESYELLFVEASFPMSFFPLLLAPQGQIKI